MGKSSASQPINENSKDVFVDGTLILDNLIWYLYDLLRDTQIVSLQDLRRKLVSIHIIPEDVVQD